MNRIAVVEKCSSTYDGWKNRMNAALEKFLNFCFENERWKFAMVLLVLLVIDMGMLVLNQLTPLTSDDFHYSYKDNLYTEPVHDVVPDSERVASLGDIFDSQYKHYFNWGGRTVAHTLAQFFLMYDKSFFDTANAVAYVLLLLMISFHIKGKIGRLPGIIVLVNAALFAFAPGFGQDFFWLTGACNYLWCGLLSFSYLLAFRFQMEQEEPVIKGFIPGILYGLLGIICGWTNENIAVTMVVLAVLFNGYTYLRKGKCYRWSIFALLGTLLGAVMLIGAPGNFVRLEWSEIYGDTQVNYLKNIVSITGAFFRGDFLLIPLSVALICYIMRKEDKIDPILWFYIIGLLVSMYAMIASPFYAGRAKLGSLLMAIIIAGRLLTTMRISKSRLRKLWAIMLVAAMAFTGTEYLAAGRAINAYNDLHEARMEIIENAKAEGNLDPIIPGDIPTTRFCTMYGMPWMLEDPAWTWNKIYARYYGVRSIRLDSNDVVEKRDSTTN